MDGSADPHNLRRTMMLPIMWLFVLVCSTLGASSASPQAITSWVSPSCSSRNAPLLSFNSGKPVTRASFPLNVAAQNKILGGLRMKWQNGSNDQTENGINGNSSSDEPPSKQGEAVPFVIQKIGRGQKDEIEELTRLCIDVFFNEQEGVKMNNDGKKQTAPWKALQLAYLGNMQKGDILARNAFKPSDLVDLIVARRVYPVPATTKINGNAADLVDDPSQIFNKEQLPSTNGSGEMYMTGEIIGYCEVSEKSFGLGGNFESESEEKKDPTTEPKKKGKSGEKRRPYMSNLSVVESARQSGVGSKLLDACEETVRDWDAGHDLIVLQVEEDNPSAIQFYKRRGWEFVYADPTCRRFDTSGFFLKESRITKYAMIKRLNTMTNNGGNQNGEGESDAGSSFIQKLKNSFFVQ